MHMDVHTQAWPGPGERLMSPDLYPTADFYYIRRQIYVSEAGFIYPTPDLCIRRVIYISDAGFIY